MKLQKSMVFQKIFSDYFILYLCGCIYASTLKSLTSLSVHGQLHTVKLFQFPVLIIGLPVLTALVGNNNWVNETRYQHATYALYLKHHVG